MGWLNTTNFHTHGLHVSPMPGSDNIFTDIDPKESFTYEFKVPSSHMGGMHFYHPHKHGASTIQAGGGAAGAPLQTETLALS